MHTQDLEISLDSGLWFWNSNDDVGWEVCASVTQGGGGTGTSDQT